MLHLNKRLRLQLHMRRCFCISNWLLWFILNYVLKSFEHFKMKEEEIIYYGDLLCIHKCLLTSVGVPPTFVVLGGYGPKGYGTVGLCLGELGSTPVNRQTRVKTLPSHNFICGR